MGRALKRSGGDAPGAFAGDKKRSFKSWTGRTGSQKDTECEHGGIPEVLFLIPAQYLALIIDEIGNVMQLVLPRLLLHMRFHNRARHYAYLEFLCQPLVSQHVIAPSLADGQELRVLGHPVREMVFGEDDEVGTF